ncbi:MAG: hypothetical protein H7070_13965 [Saprospiraceae bacterium]|nr:hypothetical protein [Pyrinomonadaceae bacterium]
MKPKEHANLLSIFFWVFAAFQTLMFLLIALYVVFMGVAGVMAVMESKNGLDGGSVVLFVIGAILLLLLAFGAVSIALNVAAGYGLRNEKAWAKKCVTAASILSSLSFMCGGMMIAPLGMALAVYGLWFRFGGVGDVYFGKTFPMQQQYNVLPPPPENWR